MNSIQLESTTGVCESFHSSFSKSTSKVTYSYYIVTFLFLLIFQKKFTLISALLWELLEIFMYRENARSSRKAFIKADSFILIEIYNLIK